MSLEHERDIEWPDSTFTLPADADINGEPIEVHFVENLMRSGGSYAIWFGLEDRGAPVAEGLSLSRAKRRALDLQDEYGSPIVETVLRT